MTSDLIPADDLRRLAALRAVGLLDTPPERAFDELVELAARLLDMPTAAVNLVDADRQWAKAAVGMSPGDEAPREESFCARAILDPQRGLVVPDASADPRFDGNALVEDGLRFYAGVPLLSREGLPLGTLCVADDRPRELDDDQLATLRVLAGAAAAQLELRRRAREAEQAAARLEAVLAERERELAALAQLSEIQRRLARGIDPAAVWNDICRAARDLCDADGALIWVLEPDDTLRAGASVGPLDFDGVVLDIDTPSRVVLAHLTGETDFMPDVRASPGAAAHLLAGHAASAVHHPVQDDGRALGVLTVFWDAPRAQFSERDRRVLELLGGEAAVAIERVRLMRRLRDLSQTDELTGAANRRCLETDLRREVERARRTGRPLAVAMLDLDHFKAFNDGFGHQAGDRLLKEAVAGWRSLLRGTDTLARYGGEEFALVLPDCDGEAGLALLERVRNAMPYEQTCSAGLAQWERGEEPHDLLGRADRALYAAKAAGRDTAVLADPDPG